jgi:hypothetical protein
MLLELVEDLLELGQTLCSTVAGGCGRAEALEELREVLFERAPGDEPVSQVVCAFVEVTGRFDGDGCRCGANRYA